MNTISKRLIAICLATLLSLSLCVNADEVFDMTDNSVVDEIVDATLDSASEAKPQEENVQSTDDKLEAEILEQDALALQMFKGNASSYFMSGTTMRSANDGEALITATDDSFVQGPERQGRNWGGYEFIMIRNNSNPQWIRKGYILFDFSTILNVESAVLELSTDGKIYDDLIVYGLIGNDFTHEWTEGTGKDNSSDFDIVGENAPLNDMYSNGLIGDEGIDWVRIGTIPAATGNKFSIDITNYCRARMGKKATFVIATDGVVGTTNLVSREGAAVLGDITCAPTVRVNTGISLADIKSRYYEELAEANALSNRLVAGTEVGCYPQSAIDSFNISLDSAREENTELVTYYDWMNALGTIVNAINNIDVYKVREGDWKKVSPPSLDRLLVSNFSDSDFGLAGGEATHSLPYYLSNFYNLANNVVEKGSLRGWIDYPTWQDTEENLPYNPRTMESTATIAYFYCTDEPWNPYYGDPNIKGRLEAAITYWLSLQTDTGEFKTRGGDMYSRLSDTVFGTKYLGETLALIANGPEIDSVVLESLKVGLRKACMWAFENYDNPEYVNLVRLSTHEYASVFHGALAYLSVVPSDDDVISVFEDTLIRIASKFQSQAGFWYESGGVDFLNTLQKMNNNLNNAYHYLKTDEKFTNLANIIKGLQEKYYQYLSYNAVLEPDGSTFVFNSAIQSKRALTNLDRIDTPFSEVITLARAFATNDEELADSVYNSKMLFLQSWPAVRPVEIFDSVEPLPPYGVVDREHFSYIPTEEESAAARTELPYLKSESFNFQSYGNIYLPDGTTTKRKLISTYVRRPSYYSIVNSGHKISDRMQFGLSMVWHPEGGVFIHNQHNSIDPDINDYYDNSWGTKKYDKYVHMYDRRTYEYNNLTSDKYYVNGSQISPTTGNKSLADGDVSVLYNLSSSGTKDIFFGENEITVTVNHEEPFMEYIPLLIRKEDVVTLSPGYFNIKRGRVNFEIIFDEDAATKIEAKSMEREVELDPEDDSLTTLIEKSISSFNKYTINMLTLQKSGSLQYTIRMTIEEPELKEPAKTNTVTETQELIDQLKQEYEMVE